MSNLGSKQTTGGVPRCFTVAELCRVTGLGRTTVSQALGRGDLEHYRIGARVVIPETAIITWLESHRISRRPVLRAVAA